MRINKQKKRAFIWRMMYDGEWNGSAIMRLADPFDTDSMYLAGYDFIRALRAYRSFYNRGCKYGAPNNPIWQIKNKLNYGRY